jgi:hypothetical protein
MSKGHSPGLPALQSDYWHSSSSRVELGCVDTTIRVSSGPFLSTHIRLIAAEALRTLSSIPGC